MSNKKKKKMIDLKNLLIEGISPYYNFQSKLLNHNYKIDYLMKIKILDGFYYLLISMVT